MKYVYEVLCVSLMLNGCAGFVQDNFQGVLPTADESWSKSNVSDKEKSHDISVCTVKGKEKFPGASLLDQFYVFYDNCMLDKGYEFHPRGLNGDKASACQFSRPACK